MLLMSLRSFSMLTIFGLFAVFGAHSKLPGQEPPTGAQIVERFVQACGGREKLDAVKSYKAVGRYRLPAYGMDAQYTKARSEKGAFLLHLQDPKSMSIKKGFDGTSTWQIRPQGFSIVEGKAAEQLAQNLLLLPEMAYRDLNSVAKFTGVEMVDDAKCYAVRFETEELGKQVFYYAVDSGLRVKHVAEVSEGGFTGEVTQSVLDYERFGDLTLPKSMTQAISNISVEIEIKEYEFNIELEPGLFVPPQTAGANNN